MAEKPTYKELEKRIQELEKIESEFEVIKADKQRLEMILSSLDTGLSLINSDYTISWVNDTIRSIFPNDNPVGKTCHRFFESSEHRCDPCPTFEAYKSGQIQKMDKYNPSKGKWYSIISQPIKDEAGQIVSVLEGITEITERKTYEQQILKEKNLLQQVMETSPVGITMVDEKGNISMANARAEEILGLERPDIYKRRYNDKEWQIKDVQGNEYPDDQLPFELVKKTGKPVFGINHSLVWPDGKKKLLSINATPLLDSSGNFNGMVSALVDITERKKSEDLLREKTTFLQNIIDTTSDLVSVTDMEGNFKFVGSSHSILGYDPDSLVGRNVMEFVHPDDYQETATAFAEFLTNREDGRKVEYRYRRADGDYLWFETVGKFILDDVGNPKEILFSTRDVTERKRAERELKRIEWMLSSRPISNIENRTENHDQGYGDLTELNRDGIIIKSIGHERLKGFANDYLELLGTSSAIYEANGDYAFGIFASGWCRMMDSASRKLCETPDNVEALNSGRWLCHESCWSDCAQKAIAKRAEVDIECNGGIRMYAVPIYAGENIIGAINFGYGDPPKDPEKLKLIADSYQLNYDDLLREATAYDSRPSYIIEMAKKRLNSTAKLIGSMVEARQALEELKEREAFIKATLDNLPVGVAVNSVDPKVNFTYMNENFAKFYRTTREALAEPNDFWEVVYTDATFREDIKKKVLEDCASNDPERMQWEDVPVSRPGKKPFYITAKNIPLPERDLMVSTIWDVTERKLAETEKEKLQAQLTQAQKMESVGRLAGGVAHDFNNMLGVILGHVEFALEEAEKNQSLYSDLKEIQNAARRSADLTKQLLTFARKEIISPKQLDLNDTVESMLNMLRRLIGEDIDLVWQPASHLWPVKMDPSQIDQILVNLCVNAKDAISGVGKLTIETGKKTFDEEYCNDHPGFIPGDFVLLAVSDNGCGMDKDTLENLFEPFFTTKEVGKGTGLGLATIYGIVKQNNGFINVYCEPGQGSTFKIYLPRLVDDKKVHKAVPEKKAVAGGTETILLVEDEPTILRMTRMMLERKGYSVLTAATPTEAIGLAETHADKIHLLMSDVVMPEMNGRNLAGKITALYPDIGLLFMSGYTSNVIAHHGVLDDGVAFIQKPFSMADMTGKVREVLDKAPDKNQG